MQAVGDGEFRDAVDPVYVTGPMFGSVEGRLRSVLDGMTEGFSLLSPDFIVIDLNAEALRLDGRPHEQIVGHSHWVLYPDSENGPIGILYKKALKERVPVSLEHRYVWADGRVSWLDMRAYPTGDGCLAVFFRDVTDRHRADQKLRESVDRFQGAARALADVLWTNDAEGRMTGEQAAWAALTGQSFDEYQGYGWSQAVHPDDAQPTIDAWQIAVNARELFTFEHRVRRHDGVWQRFAIRAVPILNDDGTIREWVGMHSDVTAATQARAQLEANAATFETLVRNNPFGVYVVDSEFRLTQASLGTLKVFEGIDPLIGRDFAEILRILWVEPLASDFIGRFRHTLETGETYFDNSTVGERSNTDEVEAYDWRIDRIVLPDGTFGVVCYFYDLSERMALEERLKQALADKDMLLREIDHRVRNSLAMVAGLLSMQSGASASPDIKEALVVASARIVAVARIHERLYKGNDLGIVEFGTYLEEICHDLQTSLRPGNMTIAVHVVHCDLPVDQAVPLGLIANELVTNAFKHAADAYAAVTVDLERSETSLTLTVSNSGARMPAAEDQAKKSGLGMSVIDLLVRQLHGSLVIPAPGAPARFEIVVPIALRTSLA